MPVVATSDSMKMVDIYYQKTINVEERNEQSAEKNQK